MKPKKDAVKNETEALITFLKHTKKGKYAPIEKESLHFTRIKEETEVIEACYEEFYYSIS